LTLRITGLADAIDWSLIYLSTLLVTSEILVEDIPCRARETLKYVSLTSKTIGSTRDTLVKLLNSEPLLALIHTLQVSLIEEHVLNTGSAVGS
jgi:hypothetical protein